MSEDIESRILECIKKAYPKDLSIKEVAAECGLNRSTAAKYLLVLVAKGKLAYRTVGKAKLFALVSPNKEGTPVEEKERQKGDMQRINSDLIKDLIIGRFGEKLLEKLDISEIDGMIKIKPKAKLGEAFGELRKIIERLGGRLNTQDYSFEIG